MENNIKKVLVSGVSGMDGSNMTDYLLKNTNHLIFGMVRRSAKPDYSNLTEALKNDRFKLVVGDLSDSQSINNLVKEIQPDYFINFAAQSFVGSSWQIPEQTFDVTAMGVLRCLEAIRKYTPNCRFYSAGSSEEMGDVQYSPQDLNHPIRPRSPYGAAKGAARFITKVWRESYNLYAIHSILYNHEGLRRGEEFVTRKITKGVARIYHSIKNNQTFEPICLGNLDAKRDWSDSEDFVDGIWKMLNQDKPKEYILSSNETHSVREFIEISFNEARIEGKWTFRGTVGNIVQPENETFETLDGKILIKIDPKFYRPCEVEILHGNSNPARQELGWTPKISFPELVARMVKNDINNYKS